MNVPMIPMLHRLTKVHTYSATGVAAAAGVGILAVTGVTGTAGTAVAAQQVTDWTPATTVQQQSIAGQANAAQKKAAANAAAKQKAAAEAAERKKQAASRSEQRTAITKKATKTTTGAPRQIAAAMMNSTQFQCFSNIVDHESDWKVTATNPSSGAYGLVQALPGTKMASAGSDWRTNAATQIKWGLDYMNDRYGSPCAAWSFWQSHNWY